MMKGRSLPSLGETMKTILVLVSALALVATATAAVPTIRTPDGITALLAPANAVADEVFLRDADGNFPVAITLYEKIDGAWTQVSLGAALRMAVYDADGTERDVLTKGFRSSATAPVSVTIPGDRVAAGQVFDLWVTMQRSDGTFPTSHHSVQKNALLAQGEHDLADVFDFHHVLNPVAS